MDRKKDISTILGVRGSGQTKKDRGSISILTRNLTRISFHATSHSKAEKGEIAMK